jgi:methionyl-tRNA formyltransferase
VKIAIWGEGPIYEASLAVCRRHDIEIGDVEDCDVLLLANFPKIVGAKTRAKPRVGALCFHPSPLPKHRGRDSV